MEQLRLFNDRFTVELKVIKYPITETYIVCRDSQRSDNMTFFFNVSNLPTSKMRKAFADASIVVANYNLHLNYAIMSNEVRELHKLYGTSPYLFVSNTQTRDE